MVRLSFGRLIAGIFLTAAVLCLSRSASYCDPSDLVPQGSTLLATFGTLAGAGVLGPRYSAADFDSGALRYRRDDLVRALAEPLSGSENDRLAHDAMLAEALRSAILALRLDMKAQNIDFSKELAALPSAPVSLSGMLEPEYRAQQGNPQSSDPKSIAIFNAAAQGELSNNIGYTLSLSNWADDWRREFYNGVGPANFSDLNEAYLSVRGGHDLTFELGRVDDDWGQGYLGGMLLSDNAPTLDQARIQFPFSLGKHFGRNYTLTQLASTFSEEGVQKYFIARRIEYAFSRRWNADFQEAVKSDSMGTFLLTPLPFATESSNFGKLPSFLHIRSNNAESNYVMSLGASYRASQAASVYGQFLIDDLKSPFGEPDKLVPRKIGYLLGATLRPDPGTKITLEYAYADPTTYTYYTGAAIWQRGSYDELGLASGPNSRDYYARIDQRLSNAWSATLDTSIRDRESDSFPEPTYSETEALTNYALSHHCWVGLGYHWFYEDPFPIAPDSSAYPVPYNAPASEGLQGSRIREQELDMTLGYGL